MRTVPRRKKLTHEQKRADTQDRLHAAIEALLGDGGTSYTELSVERLVNQAIRQLDLTRVIVAHRPETIASAARVVVLKDGRVAQELRTVTGAGR